MVKSSKRKSSDEDLTGWWNNDTTIKVVKVLDYLSDDEEKLSFIKKLRKDDALRLDKSNEIEFGNYKGKTVQEVAETKKGKGYLKFMSNLKYTTKQGVETDELWLQKFHEDVYDEVIALNLP